MNKVFNINLGGYPFTIDEDAYKHLDTYLATIHNHFEQSDGYSEITTDIEVRMAELFQEQLKGREIVTMGDVEAAIQIMGTPADFGAEALDDASEPKKQKNKKKYHTGKRLFRDTDDKIIGGVCSGIAAYFGIQDPLWVRIAFVIIGLTAGFGIPMYIILWIIIPEAQSAADRLAMRGRPINVSNIAEMIEEEVENISKNISDLSGSSKKKVVAKRKKLMENLPLRKGFHC